MEILSDATFKGNVSINGGAFFVTPKGYVNPLIETTTGSNDGCFLQLMGVNSLMVICLLMVEATLNLIVVGLLIIGQT